MDNKECPMINCIECEYMWNFDVCGLEEKE